MRRILRRAMPVCQHAAVLPCVLAACAGVAAPASAQCEGTATYIGPGVGSWFTVPNWSTRPNGSGPPSPSELALFPARAGAARTVLFAPPSPVTSVCGIRFDASIERIVMQHGTIRVGPAGLVLLGDAQGLPPADATFRIADVATAPTSVTLANLAVAPAPIGNATLRITGLAGLPPMALEFEPTAANPLPTAFIGDAGLGAVVIDQAAFKTSATGTLALALGVAEASNGTLTLSNNASAALNLRTAAIGDAGAGVLVIDNAQWNSRTTGPFIVGRQRSGAGRIDLRNQNASFFEDLATIVVGAPGRGALRVFNGATFTAPRLTIQRGGSLAHTGAITANVRIAGGELAIADRDALPFSLNAVIDGDLSFVDIDPANGRVVTGTFTVALPSIDPGESSFLALSGSGDLAGTFRVEADPALEPPPGLTFSVAASTHGFSGDFAAFQRPTFANNTTLAYAVTKNRIDLRVVPAQGRRPGVATSPQALDIPGVVRAGVSADFTGDGIQDLAVVTTSGPGEPGQLVLLTGRAASPDGVAQGYESADVYTDLGITDPADIGAVDLNDDQRPDLVVLNADQSGAQLRLIRTVGTGPGARFAPDPRGPVTLPGVPRHLDTADVNGDGDTDILLTSVLPNGRGTSPSSKLVVAENKGESNAIEVCDVDTGDDPDSVTTVQGKVFLGTQVAVVTSKGENALFLHDPNAGGGYGSTPPREFPVGLTPTGVIAVDLTGDGLQDIITADAAGGTISVVIAIPTAGEDDYSPPTIVNAAIPTVGANPRAIVAVDYDEDGDQDIAYITDESGSVLVRVLPNDGVDPMTSALLLGTTIDVALPSGVGDPLDLLVTDQDADTDDDLVIVFDTPASPRGTPQVDLSILDEDACPVNLNGDPTLDINDVLLFALAFNAQAPAADLSDKYGVFDINDVLIFAAGFNEGCP